MDRLQKLTERLPSSIQQNIQHIPGLGRKTGAQASGTGTAQGQQSGQTGQTGQTGQYPPPEWSQAIPLATPAGQNGPPPSFPEPSYQTPALAYEPHGHGISEKPAQAYHDPYPTPGSAKTAAFLAPAVPVARPERWTPVVLKPMIVLPFVILLAVLAIAMEILYFYNKKSNGFYVDPGFEAISLVISFIPVLLTFGFVAFITKANDEILRLQPYINAANGNAPAERTVLLDYVNLGSFFLIPRAIRFKDYLVALSAAIVLAAGLFQPVVAAIFVVRSTRLMMPETTTTSSAVLGLRTDFADLNNFVAAAGYAEAALIHGLGDPPFVCDGWSIAPFEFQWMLDQVARNGTASVKTFATLTTPRCSLSDDITGTGTSWTSTYNGWGTSCSATFSIEASNSGESNFGVVRVDNCALNGTIPGDSFKPIMFWFYGPGGQTSTTWCSPTIVAYNAVANMTLFNNTIGEVTLVDAITTPLNITDDYGLGLNGIFFPNATNRFVAARATSIQSTIPGSIFRAAQEKANGNVNDIFTNVSQLFEITNNFYTQYLATAGQTNFFIPSEYDTPAQIEAWQPRLWMNSLATHGFAALFLLISILLFLLHMMHRKQRRSLFLAGPPGSIASAVSLTSSARFGALLNAGDNLVDLNAKLDGMKFGIDRDTWQIIVEKDDRVEDARYGNGNGGGDRGLDEKKNKHLSVPPSLRPGRESVVGTVLHPALASSPPPTPGFHFPAGPGSGPTSPGNQNQKFDAVGTVATPNSATFMIPPQPSPNHNSPGFPVPPSPGFAPPPAPAPAPAH